MGFRLHIPKVRCPILDKTSASAASDQASLSDFFPHTGEFLLDMRAEPSPYFLKGDSFHNRVEEPNHDQPFRIRAGHTATHQIEDRFFFEFADGCRVRAAHVVCLDLK